MACISPLSIKSGDERHVVPCGKCNNCLQAKRGEWTFRLKEELKSASSACFLTLTYDDVSLPKGSDGKATLCKEHLQKFMKRLRKAQEKAQGDPLRYYSVGEYGTKGDRPHYHSILFNLSPLVLKELQGIWGLGNVYAGSVTGASIHYVTKYHLNKHKDWEVSPGGRVPPFALSLLVVADLAVLI